MWCEVADIIRKNGGEIHLGQRVVGLKSKDDRLVGVTVRDGATGELRYSKGSYFLSSMPVKDLIEALGDAVRREVRDVARGLRYRDFITVGLLLNKLKITSNNGSKAGGGLIPDNWIYVQEPEVKLGRIQIFNNWSPYMVRDRNTVLLGLEYFCNEGDELWAKSDDEFARYATGELADIDFINREDVLESSVVRMKKTYPAYFGSYNRFHVIRDFTDRYKNLFLIGRNGMHRYNNQDHSMLSAMTAVDNIVGDVESKENLWTINTEAAYHEVGQSK